MAERFFEQAYTILDPERTEVRYNGEWLGELDFAGVVRLARTTTVARLLARRLREAVRSPTADLGLRALYPLMQAYDSVAIEADVELGGTDQLYNLLAGRDVMAEYGLDPQVTLTTPPDQLLGRDEDERLEGLLHRPRRGRQRPVRQDDAAPDELLDEYYRLVMERRRRPDPLERRSSSSRASSSRARTGRRRRAAEAHFTRVVREGQAPEEVPESKSAGRGPVHLARLVERLGIGSRARPAPDRPGRGTAGRRATALDVPGNPRGTASAGRKAPFARLTAA